MISFREPSSWRVGGGSAAPSASPVPLSAAEAERTRQASRKEAADAAWELMCLARRNVRARRGVREGGGGGGEDEGRRAPS